MTITSDSSGRMPGGRLIRAGWLIDGTGGPVREQVTLSVSKGRIVSTTADGFERFSGWDLAEYTLLPGLVDGHLHLAISGSPDTDIRQRQLTAGYTETAGTIAGHLRDLLAHGVVAVRDGGDHYGHAHRYGLDHPDPVVRVRTPGRAWHRVGRYGRLIGRPLGTWCSLAESIAGDDAAIDHVKLVNSGLNSLTQFGKETPPQFELDEVRGAVKAAAARGWSVMVHANGREPVRIAVEAGCRSIEHGFFMGRDNLKRMADRGTIWVPTIGTMTAYAATLPPESPEAAGARRNAEAQLEQVATARELGVRVALGTDAGSMGVFHGAGIIEEMRLLMSAGYSLPEAVRCAAANGARLLNLAGAGTLTPGEAATFIAVPGPPTGLPASLSSVRCLVINGRPVPGIGKTSPSPPP
jgi:imidazolonepropionase-like amidohydrolase